MDAETRNQLTRALDVAMARTLQESLDYLTLHKAPKDVGQSLTKAQLALDRMSMDPPPDYEDAWLAPLYLAWYGPSHINMAYTLFTKVIALHDNTLSKGPSGVHLEDYACGPFAGQFAFALAASEAEEQFSNLRIPSIYSDDSSDPMWSLGKSVWDTTLDVLGFPWDVQTPYPHLASFRDAARSLKFRRRNNILAPVWLTAFHAAYPGQVGEALRGKIDALVQRNRPRLILVTAHPKRAQHLYCPTDESYTAVTEKNAGPLMALAGQFELVTSLRRKVAEDLLAPVQKGIQGVEEWEHTRVADLLTKRPTNWRPSYFEYVYSLYVRKDS